MASPLAASHAPSPRSGACCSSGMVPSGRGPTPMRRLPFFDTTSQNIWMSSVSVMMSSGRSWRLAPKECPTPRASSHLRSDTVCRTSYSGVRKSQCMGLEKVSRLRRSGMTGHSHCRRAPAPRTSASATTLRGMFGSRQRSLTTPSSTVL